MADIAINHLAKQSYCFPLDYWATISPALPIFFLSMNGVKRFSGFIFNFLRLYCWWSGWGIFDEIFIRNGDKGIFCSDEWRRIWCNKMVEWISLKCCFLPLNSINRNKFLYNHIKVSLGYPIIQKQSERSSNLVDKLIKFKICRNPPTPGKLSYFTKRLHKNRLVVFSPNHHRKLLI